MINTKYLILKKPALLASCMAALLSACAEGGGANSCLNPVPDIDDVGKDEVKVVNVQGMDFYMSDETRSHISEGGSFAWSSGDRIGIYPTSGGGAQLPFMIDDENSGAASASFNGGGWALLADKEYASYFPFSFYGADGTENTVERTCIGYLGQTQLANGDLGHLGGYDFMVADGQVALDNALSFHFRHIGSLLMLQLKVPASADADTRFSELTVEADRPVFAITANINFSVKPVSVTSDNLSSTANLRLNNIKTDNGELKLYMMLSTIEPSTCSSLSVSLSDGTKLYSTVLANGTEITIEPSHAYSWSAELENDDKILAPSLDETIMNW